MNKDNDIDFSYENLSRERIARLANDSAFFQEKGSFMLRMDYTDNEDQQFGCHNEETGEEYQFQFGDVKPGDMFYELKGELV